MSGYDYMGEKARPSTALMVLVLIPWVLLTLVYILTEGFNVHPSTPPYLYLFASPALAVIAIVVSVMGYLLARDEEPEWGPRVIFKAVEAAEVASMLLAALLLVLIAVTYYLR